MEDAGIIKAVLDGDIDQYAELVNRYQPVVYTIVSKRIPEKDVASVANETFVQAYSSLANYSGKSPFKNWCTGIAIRVCCMYWRQQQRHRRLQVSLDDMDDAQFREYSSSDAEQSEHLINQQDKRKLLLWVLGQLSADDRTLIESVYLDDIPLKMVAEAMGWSLVKAKVRAFRARKKMKSILERIGDQI